MVLIEVEIRQCRNARKKGKPPSWNTSESHNFSLFMYDLATEIKKQNLLALPIIRSHCHPSMMVLRFAYPIICFFNRKEQFAIAAFLGNPHQ